MKLAVHVRDLGTEAAAVVVLRTAPELIVQLISFGANMLVLPPDVSIGAVAAHLALHMLEHPVEVMDFGVKPAASRLTVKLSVAGSLTVFLVNRLDILLIVLVRPGNVSEPRESEAGNCDCQDCFIHNAFRSVMSDGTSARCIRSVLIWTRRNSVSQHLL